MSKETAFNISMKTVLGTWRGNGGKSSFFAGESLEPWLDSYRASDFMICYEVIILCGLNFKYKLSNYPGSFFTTEVTEKIHTEDTERAIRNESFKYISGRNMQVSYPSESNDLKTLNLKLQTLN